MANFKAISEYTTVPATIASATVVEAGDMVAVSAGLIIKAVAGSAEIAFAPQGSEDGETTIEVSKGYVEFVGTGDANFAANMKGTEVDLVGDQLIDVGASATDVFKVAVDTEAGTVGSTADIKVFINKPITF